MIMVTNWQVGLLQPYDVVRHSKQNTYGRQQPTQVKHPGTFEGTDDVTTPLGT